MRKLQYISTMHNLTNQQTKEEKKGETQETMNVTVLVGLCMFVHLQVYRLPLWLGRVGR